MRVPPIGVNLSRRRPPARGGPTLYERVVGLVEPPRIVGPPLAGGLPGAASVVCRWPEGNASGGGPTRDDSPVPLVEGSSIVGPPLAGGLPGAASVVCGWPEGNASGGGLPGAASLAWNAATPETCWLTSCFRFLFDRPLPGGFLFCRFLPLFGDEHFERLLRAGGDRKSTRLNSS